MTSSMRSAVVEGPHRIALMERERPEPGPGDVRVRVRYAGICGSDVHILHGENPFVAYPRIIGHELFGYVESVGRGVSEERVGERVAVDPVIACGSCYPCSVNRPNVCRRLQVVGVHRDGGFSEFLCAPAANAHLVPSGIADASAATIEPFAVAANVTHRTGVFPNDVALVYGAGPIGLMVLQVLKGVHGIRVLVTDRIDERLTRATACGADNVVNTAREPLPEALRRLDVEDGPTLVIDAVCHPAILEEAVRVAAPAGRIGMLGFSSVASAIPQQETTRKELSLFASRLNAGMFPRVIEWMKAGRLQPDRVVSHHVPFAEVHRAFELVEGDPRASSKVLLDFAPGA
jgi:L-gulonate 5-dehydrogenase